MNFVAAFQVDVVNPVEDFKKLLADKDHRFDDGKDSFSETHWLRLWQSACCILACSAYIGLLSLCAAFLLCSVQSTWRGDLEALRRHTGQGCLRQGSALPPGLQGGFARGMFWTTLINSSKHYKWQASFESPAQFRLLTVPHHFAWWPTCKKNLDLRELVFWNFSPHVQTIFS